MNNDQFVHIIDDDPDVLASLVALLESGGYRCVAYASGAAFLAAGSKTFYTGCALVDVRMPGMDGLSIIGELARLGLNIPVILMTGFGDVPLAVKAMKAGAVDFIEKPCPFSALQEVIDRALSISPRNGAGLLGSGVANERIGRLTQREREVFDRLVLGESNKAIARLFDISVRTIENHRARVMEKLGARNLPELVRLSLAATEAPSGPGSIRRDAGS